MMDTLTAQTGSCKEVTSKLPALLPDFLLDPAAVPAAARQHMDACPTCRAIVDRELAGHRAAMQTLEHWDAPEVSPYFFSRMSALLREEQQRPPAGVLERLRSWLLVSNLNIKPMAGAAALGVLLAIGGGAYLDLTQSQPAPLPQASETVRDLQSLEDNAQVFQQMSSLDSSDGDSSSSL